VIVFLREAIIINKEDLLISPASNMYRLLNMLSHSYKEGHVSHLIVQQPSMSKFNYTKTYFGIGT